MNLTNRVGDKADSLTTPFTTVTMDKGSSNLPPNYDEKLRTN